MSLLDRSPIRNVVALEDSEFLPRP